MSSSRAITGARRRAEPPQRGPNTSISSSQIFSQQQGKVMNNVNIPNGRIAGQQAALTQQQMMQQQMTQQKVAALKQKQLQEQQLQNSQFEKMTIPQAITLITLRLGKIETFIQENNSGSNGGASSLHEDGAVDMQSILARLESLEKRSSTSSSSSNSDLSGIKSQLEVLKPAVLSLKTSTSKDVKDLKQQIDMLQQELNTAKDELEQMKSSISENNKQILALSMGVDLEDYHENIIESDEYTTVVDSIEGYLEAEEEEEEDDEDNEEECTTERIEMTMNLKDIIQQELNNSGV